MNRAKFVWIVMREELWNFRDEIYGIYSSRESAKAERDKLYKDNPMRHPKVIKFRLRE